MLSYHKNAERPVAGLWIFGDDGDLIDFSSGDWTFTLKIGNPGQAALLTKSTGITGAAGAGVAPTGTPNIAITWAAGDLNLTPGVYLWQLVATTAPALDRVFTGPITIRDVVT